MSVNIYHHKKQFKLESGKKLKNLRIAYHTYGTLNARKDNVVWVCHALTASSDVFDWWQGLFGEKQLFNPDEHFIVCANILGSAYGTTSPLDQNPATGQPYYLQFPQFTIRDLVAAHRLLSDHLKISRIDTLIGGSIGGQQALEWAVTEPHRIARLILIATNARHSPWGIAFNESQRLAISTDRTFYAQHPDGGKKGLKAARAFALLSYRTYNTYGVTQSETEEDRTDQFKASSYQNYQGDKLVRRFNAFSYWYLTKAMDSHHIGRNRGSLEEALRSIKAETLVIGVSSDILFPAEEQKFLAHHIPNARYREIDSFYGHDGFLVETRALAAEIGTFLESEEQNIINFNKTA